MLDNAEPISHRLDQSLFSPDNSQDYGNIQGVSRLSGKGQKSKKRQRELSHDEGALENNNPLPNLDGSQIAASNSDSVSASNPSNYS